MILISRKIAFSTAAIAGCVLPLARALPEVALGPSTLDKLHFLCEWGKDRAPPNGPKIPVNTLGICTHPEAMSYSDVDRDITAYFASWSGSDPLAGDRALGEFEIANVERMKAEAKAGELAPHAAKGPTAQTAAQRRLENEIEQQRYVSADEAKTIAALPTASLDAVCAAYRRKGIKQALTELRRRHVFSAEELALIAKQDVRIGMSERALTCSWGEGEVNRTVTASGTHKQFVYGSGIYVYTENGVVTAFQD